jgi:hypothetical protein
VYSSLKAIPDFSILKMVETIEATTMGVETAMETMEETMNRKNKCQGVNRSSLLSHLNYFKIVRLDLRII